MKKMEELVSELNTHDWSPSWGETAVILIDLEEYFRGLILPILGNLQPLLAAAREQRIPLVFTRHRHLPGEDTGMLGRWWGDLIWENTPSSRLLPEIDARPDDIVIEKNRYSAFYQTDLEQRLKDLEVKDVVIGGVMTNLCCETTARDAYVRDFRVFFLTDGAATSLQEYHLATLRNLAYGFATLMTCGQCVESLRPRGGK